MTLRVDARRVYKFTMHWRRTILVIVVAAAFAGLSGCKKKAPKVPPPQATAPPITQPEVQPAPPATVEPTRPQPPPRPEEAQAKPKAKVNVAKKTPAKASAPPAAAPSRQVVPEGGNPPAQGQLTAQMSNQETLHEQLNTAQLLQATENNLTALSKRQLSDGDQAVVQHIRSYVQQSRAASQEGDIERAYNLAFKAHLLSDELVKK